MTKRNTTSALTPRRVAGIAAVVQTAAMVLLAADRIGSSGAVPMLALGLILWIIAFGQTRKGD